MEIQHPGRDKKIAKTNEIIKNIFPAFNESLKSIRALKMDLVDRQKYEQVGEIREIEKKLEQTLIDMKKFFMPPLKSKSAFEKQIKNLSQRISQIKDVNNQHTPIQDGIVSLDDYLQSKYRILWILKDANSPEDSNWNQLDAIANLKTDNGIKAGWEKTFQHIVYITYGILNDLKWDDIPSIEKETSIVDVLKSISFINIKKVPGGNTSNDHELWEYSKRDKEVLIDQITSFEPNIIIFGNTLKYLMPHLNLTENIDKINNVDFTTMDEKLLINIYHPNYISRGGVNAENYYTSIKQICDDFFEYKSN